MKIKNTPLLRFSSTELLSDVVHHSIAFCQLYNCNIEIRYKGYHKTVTPKTDAKRLGRSFHGPFHRRKFYKF
jgi:uncharacterized protein YktA (UPF0223 family)